MKGKLVIPPTYDRAGEFGKFFYTAVQRNNKIGIIDSTGKEIIPPTYAKLEILDNKTLKVASDSLWSLRKITGEEISPGVYSTIRKLSDYFLIAERNQLGIMDISGKVLISPAYDSIRYDKTGFFILRKNGKTGVANAEGSLLAECRYFSYYPIDSSLILVKDSSSWNGIDCKGNFLFSNIYSSSPPKVIGQYIQFENTGSKSLFSKKSGKIISVSSYQDFLIENENFIYTFRNRKMGIIDSYGKVVSEPIYLKITYDVSSSLFRINKDGKWGLMNKEGKILFPAAFDYIGKFQNGISTIKNDSGWGIINSSGKIIHPCTSDRVDIKNNEAEVYTDLEKVFFKFDNKGNVIDEVRFKKIKTLRINQREVSLIDTSNNAFGVDSLSLNAPTRYGWFQRADFKWGLKDSTGRLWIPAFLDAVTVYPELGLTLVSINSFDRERGITTTGLGVVDHIKRKFILRPGSSLINIEDFERGPVARIILTSGHALLTRDGKLITHMEAKEGTKTKSLRIAFIGSFSEDKAKINLGGQIGSAISEAGYWGYIGIDGELVIEPKFQSVLDFKLGKAIVKFNKQWGLIDEKGAWIIPNKYDLISYVPNTNDSLLYLESNRKKSGILTKDGKISIDPKYDDIGEFSEGFARAKEKGKWGYINPNGDTLTDFKFTENKDFNDGYAAVKLKNKWGYIDSSGTMTIAPGFDAAGDFHKGIACIKTKGKFGYINKSGTVLIEPKYINASDFHGNLASARTKKKFGILNPEGKWVIKPSFKKVEFCDDGYAIVKKKRYGMIDPEGKQILKCKYKHVEPFSESLACVATKDGKYGFIDSTGAMIIPPIYKNAGNFKEGLSRVLIAGKYGYINKKGEVKIEPAFKKCSDFREGKAYASTNTMNGFIDSTGKYLIPLKSFSPFYFSEGLSLINENRKYFYINSKGEMPYRSFFDNALPYKHGMAIVNYLDGYGVMDTKGMSIIHPKYDMIETFKGDYAELIKIEFQGIANLRGKIIIAPDFEVIEYIPQFKLFKVERGDAIGYLDTEGNWIWNPSK